MPKETVFSIYAFTSQGELSLIEIDPCDVVSFRAIQPAVYQVLKIAPPESTKGRPEDDERGVLLLRRNPYQRGIGGKFFIVLPYSPSAHFIASAKNDLPSSHTKDEIAQALQSVLINLPGWPRVLLSVVDKNPFTQEETEHIEYVSARSTQRVWRQSGADTTYVHLLRDLQRGDSTPVIELQRLTYH